MRPPGRVGCHWWLLFPSLQEFGSHSAWCRQELSLNFGTWPTTSSQWDSSLSAGKGRRDPRLAPGGRWSWGRQHIPLLGSALLLLLPGRMGGGLWSWHGGAAEFRPSMGSLPLKISIFGECHTTESSRLHHLPVQCQHWGRIKSGLKSLGYKLTPSWGGFLQNYFPFQVLFVREHIHLSTPTGEKSQLCF